MGSFSWNKADYGTQIANITYGAPFKFLIPKEFGGGFIEDRYQDYGDLGTNSNGKPKHDMYELLAFWNVPSQVKYNGEFPPLKEIDEHTEHNRSIGTDIGCYNAEIDKLTYPLKLVSASCKLSYEEIDRPSYGDPDQGFYKRKRNK